MKMRKPVNLTKNGILKFFLQLLIAFFFSISSLIISKWYVQDMDEKGTFLFFLCGVILSSWYGRFGSGFFAVIFSTILIDFSFLDPLNSIFIYNIKDLLLLAFYIAGALITVFAVERMHQNRHKSSEKVNVILESITDGFISVDKNWEITSMNKEAERLVKIPKEESIGKNLWKIFLKSEQTGFYNKAFEAMEKRAGASLEEYFEFFNYWLSINIFPTTEDDGLAIYLKDITEYKNYEVDLRQSKKYYRKLIDSNMIGIIFAKLSGEIVDANEALLNMLGYNQDDLEEGLRWDEITPVQFRAQDEHIINEVVSHGVSSSYEKEFIRKDGKQVPVILAVSLLDEYQDLCIGFVLDISDRKKTERKLQESEEKFRTLVNSMSDIVLLLDKDQRHIGAFGQWFEKYNMSPKSLLGKMVSEVSFDENVSIHKKHNDMALEGKNIVYEWSADRAPNGPFHFQNSVSPVYDTEGKVDGLVVVARDITELKNIEKKLIQSNQRTVDILESITDAFIALDKEWRFTYVNAQAEVYLEGKRDELIGKKIWDMYPELIGTKSYELYYEAMNNQKSISFEDQFHPANNWYEIHIYPTQEGLAIYYNDITDRKEDEERISQLLTDLEYNKKRLDSIISNVPGVVWEIWNNPNNEHKNFVSGYIEKLIGYTPLEWVSSSKFWLKIMHPEDREVSWNKYNKMINNKQEGSMQYRWITKNGGTIWVETHSRPIINLKNDVIGMRGVTMDISQRKKIEEQLQESKDQLEVIFKNVIDGITVQEKSGKIAYANDSAAIMMGLTSGNEVISRLNSSESKEILDRFEMYDEVGNIITMGELPGRKALEGQEPPAQIIKFIDKTNGRERWSLVKARPVFNDENEVIFAVNIISDITERRELEKRKDEFISIASHELKTPLTTVKAFTQILQNRFKKLKDEQAEGYLNKLEKQVDRLGSIVSDLLDISRIESGKLKLVKEKFDFNELFVDVINNLQLINESHKIINLGSVNAEVEIDRTRVEQVLINLINNAVKYSPKSNKVEVLSKIEDNKLMVSVKDYGIGIPEDEIDKIFDRFYMAKSHEGTRFFGLGLGLYISSQIIERHGGRMWVVSKVGEGSTFYFSLPLNQKNGPGN